MKIPVVLVIVLCAVMIGQGALGQPSSPSPATDAVDKGQKSDGSAVQHGAQPNAGEVRQGSRDGDSPSAAAGTVVSDRVERRIFGLPVTAALVITGVLVALAVVSGALLPRARRRSEARGNGTYGRSG